LIGVFVSPPICYLVPFTVISPHPTSPFYAFTLSAFYFRQLASPTPHFSFPYGRIRIASVIYLAQDLVATARLLLLTHDYLCLYLFNSDSDNMYFLSCHDLPRAASVPVSSQSDIVTNSELHNKYDSIVVKQRVTRDIQLETTTCKTMKNETEHWYTTHQTAEDRRHRRRH